MTTTSLEDLLLNSSSLTDDERRRIEQYLLESERKDFEKSALEEILQERLENIEKLLDTKNLTEFLVKIGIENQSDINWYIKMSEKYPNLQHIFLETLLRNQILNVIVDEIDKREKSTLEEAKEILLTPIIDLFNKSISKIFRKEIKRTNLNPNIEWLKVHRDKYAGNYVALFEGELIAFGRTIKEADTKAKAKGYKKSLLHYIPAKDEIVWGGW